MIGKLFAPLAMKISGGIIAALLAALVWCWLGWSAAADQRDSARERARAEATAHQLTKDTYRTAQAEAAALEAIRLSRVTTEQKEITDAVSSDYQRRLADLRARYDRLRNQGHGAAADGATGGEHVPQVPASPGGSAPPSCDGVPATDLDLRYCAAAQAEQLRSLIEWVISQHSVDPNALSKPPD